jgi:hypothetical protein
MTIKVPGVLRRELDIDGEPYTLTIAPDGLKPVRKGRRHALEWRARSSVATPRWLRR